MPTGLQPVPFGHSGTDPGSRDPTGWPGGPGNRSASQQALHDHHVEPPAELASDLAFDADDLEPDRSVKGDRRLVAADDASEDRMEAVLRRQLHELLQQPSSHT